MRFGTQPGQSLFVFGNHPALGNNDPAQAIPLRYFSAEFWSGSVELENPDEPLRYRYLFQTADGERIIEAEKGRSLDLPSMGTDAQLIDSWNDESFFENAFYTAPFADVFFKETKKAKQRKRGFFTHRFRVKAPLLQSNEAICMVGSSKTLMTWDRTAPIVFQKQNDWWTADLDFTGNTLPASYKYGVVNTATKEFLGFESGDNRVLTGDENPDSKTIIHDAFARLPNTKWKGAGIAIPVFSLRTASSFGVGEFTDIKCLADWAKDVGLKLIQLLPVNDTSATHTWKDSYPYAAISAFALHPLYINLAKVAGRQYGQTIKSLAKKQKQLNALPEVDYEAVMQFKMRVLRELYEMDSGDFADDAAYKEFFADNRRWLTPYAAFCVYRDRFGTADFSQWKTGSVYNAAEVERLASPKNRSHKEVAFWYFVQYHLHLQLKEAVDYAHKKGIAIKGDIPIGIYRFGADAWTAPELYNMDLQAGAPPDDFAVKGQNWGFPTYNWQRMEADRFEWWKQRFHQMSNYFDAFRIDHILGFFRIWSVPLGSVEGVMGRFIPAVPVAVQEFAERGIWFDYHRYCKPFVHDALLHQIFGEQAAFVSETFLLPNERGLYDFKAEFNTQRKIEAWWAAQGPNEENAALKQGLFDLLSNVILFEEEGSGGNGFHFRIAVEETSSFQQLDEGTKHKLRDLYVNYFYRRQDGFWRGEALKKLPALKEATAMLICGEDLGMVPHTVPDVMKRLGILSLEVQRMPKDPATEFFNPATAPYLSVVTPSTHDMSTVRGWWEEDRAKTQRFFNYVLGEAGPMPYFCEAWVARAVLLQHLYSPAMWAIFQLQDLLAASETIRREDPHEERINQPANPVHYWRYRMHVPLEQLIKETTFNNELKDYIKNSGRGN